MKKYFSLLLMITACSDAPPEEESQAFTVYEKAKNFPNIEKTIYGAWMETEEIYKDKISQRRWFYISPIEFGIGQWCFQGKKQNFSEVSVPAQALDETLIVLSDLQANGKSAKSIPCRVDFPQGHYGLNYNFEEEYLRIIFPQTGEIISAVRYSSPMRLEPPR